MTDEARFVQLARCMGLFSLLRIEKCAIRLRFANDCEREIATAEIVDLEVVYRPFDGTRRMLTSDESMNEIHFSPEEIHTSVRTS